MPRRTLLLLLLTVAAVALGAVAFFRDVTPPEFLALTLPSDAPAGEGLVVPFHISENVGLTVTSNYANVTVEARNGEMLVPIGLGPQTLNFEAIDRAGNSTTLSYVVTGRSKPVLQLKVPTEARRADPITAELTIAPAEFAAAVTDVRIEADGEYLLTHSGVDRVVRGMFTTSLNSTNANIPIEASVIDQFGREHEVATLISIVPRDDVIFEVLQLSGETLSISTPDARFYEEQLFTEVYENASRNPFPSWIDHFIQPSGGWVSSNFGDERQYSEGGNISYHTGHDYATPHGTPILATNAGVVVIAEMLPIKGGTVVIDHGAGLVSIYMHQSEILAEVGDVVKRGELIGLVGTTGMSTGPHLHWEMRLHGVESAPTMYIGRVFP